MKHLHFEEINSTQSYLKENIHSLLSSSTDILISCERQTNGFGSKNNTWIHHPKSLAISFTLLPNQNLTLSTIELGLIVLDFFRSKSSKDLFLKWPNDLVTSNGLKCGGMISHFHSSECLIFGLGLNINLPIITDSSSYRYGIDGIDLSQIHLSDFSLELYQYILNHRINDTQKIIHDFKSKCLHQDKIIEFSDDLNNYQGIFKGIDQDGRAILEIEPSIIKSFISGSVTLIN